MSGSLKGNRPWNTRDRISGAPGTRCPRIQPSSSSSGSTKPSPSESSRILMPSRSSLRLQTSEPSRGGCYARRSTQRSWRSRWIPTSIAGRVSPSVQAHDAPSFPIGPPVKRGSKGKRTRTADARCDVCFATRPTEARLGAGPNAGSLRATGAGPAGRSRVCRVKTSHSETYRKGT